MMAFHEAPEERRRFPRTQIQLHLQAILLDPDGDIVDSMEMLDVSRGGVGATSRRAHYPGQRVLLKLPAPGLGVRNVCGIVKRCSKRGQQYQLGIEFERPLASLAAEVPETIEQSFGGYGVAAA